MDRERVHTLGRMIEKQIQSANPVIFKEYPLQRYIDLLARYPRSSGYSYVSDEVRALCDNVIMNSNGHVLELYNKCLLLALIDRAVDGLGRLRVPDEVRSLFRMNFERIVHEIENSKNEAGFYMYQHDGFLKELGICSLKLIPAGAQKIGPAVLPVEFLFRKGTTQFISGLSYVLFELKGISNFYTMLTDSHDPHLMAEFNADGWRAFLRRATEILRMNPEMKGIFGRSWFIDPQLEKISPKVCYVRHLLYQSGGKAFYLGPAVNGIDDAVHKSSIRRQLFDRGRYIPMDYLGIWSRKSLLQWADKQKGMIQ